MGVKSQLKKTKKELIKRGWAKTDLVDEKGCVCILGAVGFAVLGDAFDVDYKPFKALGEAAPVVNALAKQLVGNQADVEFPVEPDYSDLYSFNDCEAKRVEDVIALIDKAIEAA